MAEATHAAEAAPAPLFPREVSFARLRFSTRFADRAEFDAFLKRERELWAPLQNSPHHAAQNAARQNIHYLDEAQRSANEVAASTTLTLLENEFIPLSIGPGTLLAELSRLTALVPRLVFLGTLAGVGVWLIRQFLRDLRNQEHLAEDAAERVTMIETLSALQAFGLRNDDLSTILSALYRPAAAAMADDGGPVLPIEVLMKGVADAASRGRA